MIWFKTHSILGWCEIVFGDNYFHCDRGATGNRFWPRGHLHWWRKCWCWWLLLHYPGHQRWKVTKWQFCLLDPLQGAGKEAVRKSHWSNFYLVTSTKTPRSENGDFGHGMRLLPSKTAVEPGWNSSIDSFFVTFLLFYWCWPNFPLAKSCLSTEKPCGHKPLLPVLVLRRHRPTRGRAHTWASTSPRLGLHLLLLWRGPDWILDQLSIEQKVIKQWPQSLGMEVIAGPFPFPLFRAYEEKGVPRSVSLVRKPCQRPQNALKVIYKDLQGHRRWHRP